MLHRKSRLHSFVFALIITMTSLLLSFECGRRTHTIARYTRVSPYVCCQHLFKKQPYLGNVPLSPPTAYYVVATDLGGELLHIIILRAGGLASPFTHVPASMLRQAHSKKPWCWIKYPLGLRSCSSSHVSLRILNKHCTHKLQSLIVTLLQRIKHFKSAVFQIG